MQHKAKSLESIYNQVFYYEYKTRLCGGVAEPLYRPAQTSSDDNVIFYREDYFSSALHEIAHWCIAGTERRDRVDYGYWYTPDGRTQQQQKLFEKVEVKPQALEKLFSSAANYPFHLSVDNLSLETIDLDNFSDEVNTQLAYYSNHGLPQRGQQFYSALLTYYVNLL